MILGPENESDTPTVPSPFVEEAPDKSASKEEAVSLLFPEPSVSSQEGAPEDGRSEETIFAQTYTVGTQDIGFTPQELFLRAKGEDKEPNERDEEILRALLFDGYYEHKYKISTVGSFTLRTVGPITLHRSELAVRKLEVDEDNKNVGTRHLVRAALIARLLSRVNGKPTCASSTQEKFESQEAIETRLRYVLSLPTQICDVIADRINGFLNRTGDVTRRNVTNF